MSLSDVSSHPASFIRTPRANKCQLRLCFPAVRVAFARDDHHPRCKGDALILDDHPASAVQHAAYAFPSE